MVKRLPAQLWTQWVPACGIVVVMLYYAVFLYRHALNLPFQDDIFDILHFLNKVVQSTDGTQVFKAFFENYNEHRTMASRLVYYLAFVGEGEINFRTLIFLANLALPLLLLMLYLAVRKHSHALLVLLPAALVLFQPRYYELGFFSMGAFAFMFVYVYGFASLLCLHGVNVKRFLAALGFATLCSFTLASGLVIWVVGLASLLHQTFILRRCSWAYPVGWLVCAVLIVVAWRFGHATSHTMDMVLTDMLAMPLHYSAYFLTLLGDAVSSTNVFVAASVGALLLSLVTIQAVRYIAREDITLVLFAAFIILNLLTMAIGRATFFKLEYALESRLTFHSVLLLATTIVLVLSRLPAGSGRLKIYPAVSLLAFVYWLTSFQTYSSDLQGELERRIQFYNAGSFWVVGHSVSTTKAIVDEAVALGVYNPPVRPVPKPDIAPSPKRKKPPNLTRIRLLPEE